MSEELRIEDKGKVKDFVIPKPSLYVAMFFMKDSDVPFGTTNPDKQSLLNGLAHWTCIDRSKPVRIYELTV